MGPSRPADDDRDRIAYLSGDADVRISDDADRAELDELRALLADPALWAEPPASLEDAVVAAIQAERATRVADLPEPAVDDPASSPVAAERAPDRPGDEVAAHRRRRADQRSRFRPLPLIAAAAAVVVIALTAFFVLRPDSAPRFNVALSATEVVPGAQGSAAMVKTNSGWEIRLDATGLPRLDSGRYYQAWLKNAAGVLVPIGSFNEGTNVVLWSGVSPKDYPVFTITQEAADGQQGSSGIKVLSGTAVPG